MMPKAPGLFSTTQGWPSAWRSWSHMIRVMMSVALPAPYGRMTLIGFEGYLSCAKAGHAANPKAAKASSIKCRRFMAMPSVVKPRGPAANRASPQRGLLGEIDLHLGRDLPPRVELALEPGLGFFRRLADLDADKLLVEGFLQRRLLRGLDDRVEQGVDHRLRRCGRGQHALPVQRADA